MNTSISINTEGEIPYKYNLTTVATHNEDIAQPFGAIGGMPATCEYLSLKVPMSRLPVEYALASVQNAHAMVFANTADGPDTVLSAVKYVASAPTAALNFARNLPKYEEITADILREAGSDEPEWVPETRGGRFGALLYETFNALTIAQRQGLAVERAMFADSDAYPNASTVAAYATLRIELTKSMYWRAATSEEACNVIAPYVASDTDGVLNKARAEMKVCKPHTRWALSALTDSMSKEKKAQPSAWARPCFPSSGCDDLGGAGASSSSGATELPVWPGSPSPSEDIRVCHIATLCAHPAFKGSGRAVLQAICSMADESGIVLVLEALPVRSLPLYYADFGFRFAVWDKDGSKISKPLDRKRLSSQNGIHMLRFPQGSGSGPSDGSDAAELARVFTSRTISLDTFGAPMSKVYQMHRSLAVHEHWKDKLVWRTAAKFDAVLSYATWAAEYARQALSGELGRAPPFVRPAGDKEREDEEAAQAVARAAMLASMARPPPPAAPARTVPPPTNPPAGSVRARSDSIQSVDSVNDRPTRIARVSVETQVTPGRFTTAVAPTTLTFSGCTFNGTFHIRVGGRA